jgi:protease-4
MPELTRRAVATAGLAAGGMAAAAGVRVGDFGVGDALRLARDIQRGPIILTLDLTRPLRPTDSGLAALRARHRPTLRDVVETVLYAARDDRVTALVCRVGATLGGLATVQELTDALRTFAATGKPTVAHAESFGELRSGTVPYLLATAFSEIHLQPTGDVPLMGVLSEVTFLRGALDKIGVEPQFGHRHEYKNASDVLTERGFTPAHREAVEAVVDSWSTQIVATIATARGLEPAAVRDAIDHAPLSAHEALEHRLVDRLAYRDETVDDVRARVSDDAELTQLRDYRTSIQPRQRWRARRAKVIGLIGAEGPITQGRERGVLSGPIVTSDRLTAALRLAAQDDDIAAVVLRVNSPGGSAVASDAIHREVLRTRRAGTPVVAWMGDVAGSGGYFIAMGAEPIVAQPGTLTGSIGVVGGKAVMTELEDKLGLGTEAVARGANARFYSSTAPFSSDERERLDAWLDRVYDDFTEKVGEDRGLTRDQVDRIARGRIWTGAQAHDHGLVDQLGGYTAALDAVREQLALPADAPLRVRPYPPPPSFADRLRGTGPDDPAEQEVAAALAAMRGDASALTTALAAMRGDASAPTTALARLAQPAGALAMPFVPRLR